MARRTFIDTANAARLLPTVPDLDLGAGDVPIFSTLALADEWEAKNPGKRALTLEPSTPDTTPPTPGVLKVEPSDVSVVLRVDGARDDRVVTGYSFRVNGGAWSPWQSASEFTSSGLPPSTPGFAQHRVRDAAGNEATGAQVQFTTTAVPAGPSLPWMPEGAKVVLSDTFSGGDRTSFTGYVPDNALGGTLTPAPYLSVADAFRIEGGHLVATATGRFLYDVGAKAGDGKGWYASYRLVEVPTEGDAARSLRLRTGITATGAGNEVIHEEITTAYEYGVYLAADGTLTAYHDGQPFETSTGSVGGPYAGLVSARITRAVISQIVIAEVPA